MLDYFVFRKWENWFLRNWLDDIRTSIRNNNLFSIEKTLKQIDMTLFFYLFHIVTGSFFTLVAFKIYNPFKNQANKEKEIEFYKKSGPILKIIGPALLIIGVIQTLIHFL